jgi:centromere protein C
LPPRSRSPTKTQLGSSPRRSLGPRSSPLYAGHVAATRANITTGSSPIETQPHDATSVEHSQAAKTPEANSRKRKRIFELSTTETEEDEATRDIGTEMDPNPLDNDVTDEPMRDWDMLSNGEQQPDGVAEQSGISRNSRADLIATSEHVNAVESRRGKARGRPKTATANNVNIAEGDENSVAQITTASNRRRGRPRRDAALPQNIGAAETDKENKPSGTNIKIKRSKIGATKAKPSPSERNLNARVTGDTLVRNEGDYSDKGRPKPRSLLMLRSETPAEDNGALLLRSGRTSVKPLAFWRNERIVYDKYSIEGVKLPLPGMKEVIRTEEAPAPERKIKKRGRKSRKLSKVSEDEKDDGQEEWEKEDGVLEASVMDWDSETQRGLEENPVEIRE